MIMDYGVGLDGSFSMSKLPFTPGQTVTVNATDASGSTAAALPANGGSVRVANVGVVAAYIAFGGAAVSAATTDMPILPGTAECFGIGMQSHVAARCATGQTATLMITGGDGA